MKNKYRLAIIGVFILNIFIFNSFLWSQGENIYNSPQITEAEIKNLIQYYPKLNQALKDQDQAQLNQITKESELSVNHLMQINIKFMLIWTILEDNSENQLETMQQYNISETEKKLVKKYIPDYQKALKDN